MARIAAGLLLAAAAAHVHAAEFRAAYGAWRCDLAGFVDDRGERLDFQEDLGAQADGGASIALTFDGARGLWPDWALGYTRIAADGLHERTTPLMFGPIVVGSMTTELVTAADFDETEAVLRYPLGRSGLSLGAAVKWLQGEVVITDRPNGTQARHPYDEVFPQAHLRVRWPLNPTIAIAGAGQGITYGDNRAVEWRAGIEVRLAKVLFEAGWQHKEYRIRVDDYAMDAQLDGLLLQAGVLLGRRVGR